jgi:hypothetical protein
MRPATMRLTLALALAAGLTACAPPGSRGPTADLVQVVGTVSAGPTCPVERQPPDPACSERPVAGANVSVRDADGREVASVVSGADGRFAVTLAPGTYRIVSSPVQGLLGTPSPVDLSLTAGEQPVTVDLSYDTGIR